MNTVHSAILPQNTDPINDHDGAIERAFDVYAAYQHALADADVSFPGRLTRKCQVSSRNPDIPSPGSNPISYGACYVLRW
jgi:hypothetical protein